MGKFRILIFIICLSFLGVVSQSVQGQDILRIHIIANSNSPSDQFIKYQVRDSLLAEYSKDFRNINTTEDINTFLDKNLGGMLEMANQVLQENGFSYTATGEKGSFQFPTRKYLDVIYPKGEYDAVRIVLGEGKGDNWWCVMFPPLCFVGETKNIDNTNVTTIDNSEVEESVEIDFFVVKGVKRILSWVKGLF